jgi:hypothetical protein
MIFPEELCPEGNMITEANISTNHPSGRSINDIFNETELSKHIWKLKRSGRPYNTAWFILKKAVPYTSGIEAAEFEISRRKLAKQRIGNLFEVRATEAIFRGKCGLRA